ncbi:MAG: MFS transporter [Gammaproteobacteria bacterium]|nr:MAG: MFS transporter [Gammaproteobacteria bacterium]
MQRKSRALTDLLLSIVIPSIILINFSSVERLGPQFALVVALAFPVGLCLYELLRYRAANYIALLGLVSVLLTGGIGLLQLDPQWLAVKEAAIPAVLGVAVLLSAQLGYPLVKTLLYNPAVLDTGRISRMLRERGRAEAFHARLLTANTLLGATFFFSAAMNYLLTTWIVTSPAGSAAFNQELGRLALLSYPLIVLPCMAMMLAIMFLLWRSIQNCTGLKLEQALAPSLVTDKNR